MAADQAAGLEARVEPVDFRQRRPGLAVENAKAADAEPPAWQVELESLDRHSAARRGLELPHD